MGLFANFPVEDVTVLDIAAAAQMTPAAVYYHFESKDQILLEGLESFTKALLAEAGSHLSQRGDTNGLRNLIGDLLEWIGQHRISAKVYFVKSTGLHLRVEELRLKTRVGLTDQFSRTARAARPDLKVMEAGVVGVALVSLLETSAVAMLTEDAVYHGVGALRFPAEVQSLGDRIAGFS